MKIFRKRKDTFNFATERACLTCSTKFAGRYCPTCGEKVIEPDDRSFKHFVGGVVNAFTFLDSKFINSLKTLLLRPGKLSADIVIGRRQPYMKPIAFFFVGNFIYFLMPVVPTFNATLYAQMEWMEYSPIVQEMVSNHLEQTGETLERLSLIYNPASTNLSKLLMIALVILMFPFVMLINHTRKSYLSDHLMFALENITYGVFVPTLIYGSLLKIIITVGHFFDADLIFLMGESYSNIVILLILLYFYIFGIRRFYQFPWLTSVLGAGLHVFAMGIVITFYRFLLFLITLWSL